MAGNFLLKTDNFFDIYETELKKIETKSKERGEVRWYSANISNAKTLPRKSAFKIQVFQTGEKYDIY